MLLRVLGTLPLLLLSLTSYASGGEDRTEIESIYLLAPDNDTRANIGLLLEDKQVLSYKKLEGLPFYHQAFLEKPLENADFSAENDSISQQATALQLDQAAVTEALNRLKAVPEGRCISSNARAVAQFLTQISQAKLSLAEKQSLAAERLRLAGLCENAADNLTSLNLNTAPAQDYGNYLQAIAYFYAGKFELAEPQFKSLTTSTEAWLKETAQYLLARVYLDQAQGEYGYPEEQQLSGRPQVNNELLNKAQQQFTLYLEQYPKGLYSDSARGLYRKIYWLSGDNTALTQAYDQLLQGIINNKPDHAHIISAIAEIERKYAFDLSENGYTWQSPLLASIGILKAMRENAEQSGESEPLYKPVSLQLLNSKKAIFEQTSHTELYDYLLLANSFYVEHDYPKVISMTDSDKPAKVLSNVAFSRQILRGLAMGALSQWPKAEELWTQLLNLENRVGQQIQLQYLLAVTYQQEEQLEKIYQSGSPIKLSSLHQYYISFASPTLLESILNEKQLDNNTLNLAFKTFLQKSLIHRQYSEFLRFFDKFHAIPGNDKISSDINTSWQDYKLDNDCAPLIKTISAIAKKTDSAPLLNCYGDYLHNLGLDYIREYYDYSEYFFNAHELSSHYSGQTDFIKRFQDNFAGKSYSSLDFYMEVIESNRASSNAKAYALHRAISCYEPSSYNHCGSQDIPKTQRKAWFMRLKNKFKDTEWAERQKYYW